MSLNSFPFIFYFLPVVFLVWTFLAKGAKPALTIWWMLLASVFCYSFWCSSFLLVLLFSVIANWSVARLMSSASKNNQSTTLVFWLGIVVNLLMLGYFKYTNFALEAGSQIVSIPFHPRAIFLPMGISFFTFTQIAFLVDVKNGMTDGYDLRDYFLFVAFFPYLLAGPIVYHGEVIPQFNQLKSGPTVENVSVGLTLFIAGLFKKVILADGVSAFSTPVFDAVANGHQLAFFQSWFGALAYTLQLYFDFSGYSDMALGVARIFGVTLPQNFNSPYKAANIIDFWSRWHMTLTRFLTAYIYNPIVLSAVRRRIAKGQPVIQRGVGTVGAFIFVVAIPTLITMFISGLWHGAGWTFIIFGMLHGVYLVINHGWHMIRKSLGHDLKKETAIGRLCGQVVTFVGVVITFVFFRANDVATGVRVLKGMMGLYGISISRSLVGGYGSMGRLFVSLGGRYEGLTLTPIADTLNWVIGLSLIVFFLPNTQEWLQQATPALGKAYRRPLANFWRWTTDARWAIFTGALAVFALWAVAGLARPTEFLYYKF